MCVTSLNTARALQDFGFTDFDTNGPRARLCNNFFFLVDDRQFVKRGVL